MGRESKQALFEKAVADFMQLYDSVKARLELGLSAPELSRDIKILLNQAEYLYDNTTRSPADVKNRMEDLEELLRTKFPNGLSQ